MASIFKPYQKKLQNYQKRLEVVVAGIESAQVVAYNSIPDMTKGLSDLRQEILAQLAAVQNNMVVTEATLAASTSAGSTSGVAKALLMIKTWGEEIMAAAKCFALLGTIVALLLKIPILLAKKLVDLAELSIRLALENTLKYLEELKNDLIAKINKAKAKAIADAKKAFYANTKKQIESDTISTKKIIEDRTLALKNQGMTEENIAKDSLIMASKMRIKTLESKLALIIEQGA